MNMRFARLVSITHQTKGLYNISHGTPMQATLEPPETPELVSREPPVRDWALCSQFLETNIVVHVLRMAISCSHPPACLTA